MIGSIAVGIVAGLAVPGVVTAHDLIDPLAHICVAILLFVVGLKLDLQHICHIGPVALKFLACRRSFILCAAPLIPLLKSSTTSFARRSNVHETPRPDTDRH